MSLIFDNPVQPVLAIPTDLVIWQQCESLPDSAGRWRAYLHRLGLAALQAWIQEGNGQSVYLWPTDGPSDIWQLVDGLALTLGSRRVVVMLSETIDAAMLQVPQEWVDIPGWAADYYIAAHVDIDAQQLVLWGYAPYAQVKSHGVYSLCDRTYILSDVDLIQDFSVFWVAQQIEQLAAVLMPALPSLLAVQAERLIDGLANAAEPRIAISFGQWGALLSDPRWRQQLWQRRQGITPITLGRWLSRVFEPDWRSLESLFPQTRSLAFRSAPGNDPGNDPATGTGNEPGNEVISRGKRFRLNGASGELVLVVRFGTVGTREGDRQASPENHRCRIQIQLFPSDDDDVLPRNLTLALDLPETTGPETTGPETTGPETTGPETSERLQSVQAGDHDNYIQLPSFRCPPGQRFRVQVQLAEAAFQEDFIS